MGVNLRKRVCTCLLAVGKEIALIEILMRINFKIHSYISCIEHSYHFLRSCKSFSPCMYCVKAQLAFTLSHSCFFSPVSVLLRRVFEVGLVGSGPHAD